MHLVEITPAPCIVCGTGNVPGPNGERKQFVDLERDVNWNEPILLCEDCGLKVGGLLGMPSPEVVQAEKARVRVLEQELHDTTAKIDKLNRRAKKLGIEFTPVAS